MISYWWIGNTRVPFTQEDREYYHKLIGLLSPDKEISLQDLCLKMENVTWLSALVKTKSFVVQSTSYFQRMCQLALSLHDAEYGRNFGLIKGKGYN